MAKRTLQSLEAFWRFAASPCQSCGDGRVVLFSDSALWHGGKNCEGESAQSAVGQERLVLLGES